MYDCQKNIPTLTTLSYFLPILSRQVGLIKKYIFHRCMLQHSNGMYLQECSSGCWDKTQTEYSDYSLKLRNSSDENLKFYLRWKRVDKKHFFTFEGGNDKRFLTKCNSCVIGDERSYVFLNEEEPKEFSKWNIVKIAR